MIGAVRRKGSIRTNGGSTWRSGRLAPSVKARAAPRPRSVGSMTHCSPSLREPSTFMGLYPLCVTVQPVFTPVVLKATGSEGTGSSGAAHGAYPVGRRRRLAQELPGDEPDPRRPRCLRPRRRRFSLGSARARFVRSALDRHRHARPRRHRTGPPWRRSRPGHEDRVHYRLRCSGLVGAKPGAQGRQGPLQTVPSQGPGGRDRTRHRRGLIEAFAGNRPTGDCRSPIAALYRPTPGRSASIRARSSAGEHYVDIVGVTGSIPVAPTILRSRSEGRMSSEALAKEDWASHRELRMAGQPSRASLAAGSVSPASTNLGEARRLSRRLVRRSLGEGGSPDEGGPALRRAAPHHSKRKPGVAFDELLAQLGAFAGAPAADAVDDAVAKRA